MSQIMVVTESVQSAGQRIQALSQEIETLIGQCQSTALSVQSEWTGQASAAFENAMVEWRTAAGNIQMAAANIGRATQAAGGNYAETEAANTSMFR
jgi:WXG100 family type VII secretion target